jgi:hypothetical protein
VWERTRSPVLAGDTPARERDVSRLARGFITAGGEPPASHLSRPGGPSQLGTRRHPRVQVLPPQVLAAIVSNDPQEPLNNEIRLRVDIFPGRDAIIG